MSENTTNTPISTNELTARLQKAENIRARDGVVWKDKFDRTHTIADARELVDGTPVRLAGRVTALRWLGKLMFGRMTLTAKFSFLCPAKNWAKKTINL